MVRACVTPNSGTDFTTETQRARKGNAIRVGSDLRADRQHWPPSLRPHRKSGPLGDPPYRQPTKERSAQEDAKSTKIQWPWVKNAEAWYGSVPPASRLPVFSRAFPPSKVNPCSGLGFGVRSSRFAGRCGWRYTALTITLTPNLNPLRPFVSSVFSENSFASLINRAPPSPRLRRTRRACRRARMASLTPKTARETSDRCSTGFAPEHFSLDL